MKDEEESEKEVKSGKEMEDNKKKRVFQEYIKKN